MAITINGITVIDDSGNANVSQVVLSSFGAFEVQSNTAPLTPPAAGTVDGYCSGGTNPTVPAIRNGMQKFPFASDGNATNIGSLIFTRRRGASCSSEVAGYIVGGDNAAGSLPPAAGDGYFYSIEKFLFAADSTTTMVGTLLAARIASGLGCSSPTHGYSGGIRGVGSVYSDTERFPFANEAISTTVGAMQYYTGSPCEFGSTISGYIAMGNISGSGSPLPTAPPNQTFQTTAIQKYMFANESDAVQVGDGTVTRFLLSGLTSPTHGYMAGGVSPTPVHRYKIIDKMSFASEGTATFVGNLSSNNGSTGACTSTSSGYVMGGATANNPPTPAQPTNLIDKFPFASDADATDVGDLTDNLVQPFGNQN